MALPNFTTQDATTYKTNIDGTASDHETRVTQNESDISSNDSDILSLQSSKLDASRFPNVNANVTPTDEELNTLDGVNDACAAGYERIAPGFCYRTSAGSSTVLSTSSTNVSVPAGAKAALVSLAISVQSTNSVGQRLVNIDTYYDSVVVSTLQQLAYEFNATTADTIIGTFGAQVIAPVNSDGNVKMAKSAGAAEAVVNGYWT